jgi:hypothetical protein
MPTTIELANHTLVVFSPSEDPHDAYKFADAERKALETELAARGYTLDKGTSECIPGEGTLFRATRVSDGKRIAVRVTKK